MIDVAKAVKVQSSRQLSQRNSSLIGDKLLTLSKMGNLSTSLNLFLTIYNVLTLNLGLSMCDKPNVNNSIAKNRYTNDVQCCHS